MIKRLIDRFSSRVSKRDFSQRSDYLGRAPILTLILCDAANPTQIGWGLTPMRSPRRG